MLYRSNAIMLFFSRHKRQVTLGIVCSLVLATLAAIQYGTIDCSHNRDSEQIRLLYLEQMLNIYALKHDGFFPPSQPGLTLLLPYLKSKDMLLDSYGRPIYYHNPTESSSYTLIALGKDGIISHDDIHSREL